MARPSKRLLQPPPIVPILRTHGNLEMKRLQENVDNATREARAMPQIKGRKQTIKMPAHSGGTLQEIKVPHGLGRKPEGYHAGIVKGSTTPKYKVKSMDSRFITFESSISASVEMWVY